GSIPNAAAVHASAPSRRPDRAHHRRFRLRARTLQRRALALDDPSTAFVVFHCGGIATMGATLRRARRIMRSPMEARAHLADRFSAWASDRAAALVQSCLPRRNSSQSFRRHARRIAPGIIAMSTRLSIVQITILSAYAVALAGGQLLFKSAALRLPSQGTL